MEYRNDGGDGAMIFVEQVALVNVSPGGKTVISNQNLWIPGRNGSPKNAVALRLDAVGRSSDIYRVEMIYREMTGKALGPPVHLNGQLH